MGRFRGRSGSGRKEVRCKFCPKHIEERRLQGHIMHAHPDEWRGFREYLGEPEQTDEEAARADEISPYEVPTI